MGLGEQSSAPLPRPLLPAPSRSLWRRARLLFPTGTEKCSQDWVRGGKGEVARASGIPAWDPALYELDKSLPLSGSQFPFLEN